MSTDIDTVVEQLGIEIKSVGRKDITGRCPVHEEETGGHVQSSNTYTWRISRLTGKWFCHSCHAGGDLPTLIFRVTGSRIEADEVRREMAVTKVKERRLDGAHKKDAPVQPRITEAALRNYGEPPWSALEARSLSRISARRYGVRWDSQERAWITPIVDVDGQFMGWQEKQGSYVRNWPEGVLKSLTMFGVYEARECERIIVVESPLDVLRIWTAGYDGAVATFGASVSDEQIAIMRTFPEVILAFDNDDAGRSARRAVGAALRGRRVLMFDYGDTDAKDPGDMTDEQIDAGIANATMPLAGRILRAIGR